MPYISVKLTAKPDTVLSNRIAQQVGEITRKHMGKDPTVTAIAIDYVDPQHWFVGGQAMAALGHATYWLDIKVTDGTNTKQEMAVYLEEIHAAMLDALGNLSGTSYVLVHNVPAPNWGFGGKTQEFRFISGRVATAA